MDSKQAIEKLRIIEKLASCELEARYVRQIIELIERQERMIGLACEWLQKIGCPILDDHYCDENCSTEMNGSGCWRRWLEEEAGK